MRASTPRAAAAGRRSTVAVPVAAPALVLLLGLVVSLLALPAATAATAAPAAPAAPATPPVLARAMLAVGGSGA